MSRIIRRDFYRDLVIVFIIAISIPFMLLLIAALITQTLQAASLTLRTIQALVGVYAMILSIMAYATARKSELRRTSYEELDDFRRRLQELEERVCRLEEGSRSGMFILVLTLILHAYSSKLSI